MARRRGRRLWVALAIALPSLISAWSLAGPQLNADTILYPVMALQQLTLFYWGQNRLANVVPALTAPIGDADLNLAATLVIFALAWHCLLWLLAAATRWLAGDRHPAPPVLGVYALLTALSHALLTTEARYVLIAEGQPYALSAAALLAAVALAASARDNRPLGAARDTEPAGPVAAEPVTAEPVTAEPVTAEPVTAEPATAGPVTAGPVTAGPVAGAAPRQPRSAAARWGRRLLALALLTVALGLNPAALALALALALAALLAGAPRRPLAVGVALATALSVAWLAAGQLLGPPMTQPSYLALRSVQQKAHLMQALGNLWGTLTLPWLGLALALLGALAVEERGTRPTRWLQRSLGALALAWLLLFSSNRWVVVNHLHWKYFFPILLAALWAWSWAVAEALRLWPALARRGGRGVALAAALLASGIGGEPRSALAEFGALAAAEQRLVQLPASPRPLLVGGDYWQVWPLVHRALAAQRPVFATAERGDARRGTLLQQLDAAKESPDSAPWIAVCVGADEATCSGELQRLTRRPWHLGPAHGCGASCQWRPATPGGPLWNCPPQIDFSSEDALPDWTTAGLGPAEPHGRWTVGRAASLRCWWPADQPPPRALRLSVRAYLPSDQAVQRILPGESATPLATLSARQPSASVELPLRRAADGALEAHLRLPDATAPADHGLGGDERPLGVAVRHGSWVR